MNKIIILGSAFPFRVGIAALNERLAVQLLRENHDVNKIANAIKDFFKNYRYKEFSRNIIEEKKRFSWEHLTSTIFQLKKEIENG